VCGSRFGRWEEAACGASLIDADAAKESVIKSSPELIAALKQAYRATESKLEDTTTPESYEAVNDRLMSRSDPDAAAVRRGGGDSRPRYHHHRAIDDQKGVITAVETTPGSIPENKKLLGLIEQHEKNTGSKVEVAIADYKYGTQENYVACAERGTASHMGDATAKQNHVRSQGIFPESAFAYDPVKDIYRCPAGETLKPRRLHWANRTIEYKAAKKVCAGCLLRAQCTRASNGRTLRRHEKQVALDQREPRRTVARPSATAEGEGISWKRVLLMRPIITTSSAHAGGDSGGSKFKIT